MSFFLKLRLVQHLPKLLQRPSDGEDARGDYRTTRKGEERRAVLEAEACSQHGKLPGFNVAFPLEDFMLLGKLQLPVNGPAIRLSLLRRYKRACVSTNAFRARPPTHSQTMARLRQARVVRVQVKQSDITAKTCRLQSLHLPQLQAQHVQRRNRSLRTLHAGHSTDAKHVATHSTQGVDVQWFGRFEGSETLCL
jgi:hypothetical protein